MARWAERMSEAGRNTLWALAVLIAAVGFAASPFVVSDFSGFDGAGFPVPQIDPPVQPAGYAFAIWGPIYLWLLASAGFGLLARRSAPDWAAMRPALVLSLGVGVTWLPVAVASALGATILIWVMLLAALRALMEAPRLDRWWARAPIAVYAGWLSGASFVALGVLMAGYGLISGSAAAHVCLVLALVFASVVQWRLRGVPEYGAAVIWALAGVAVANLGGVASVFWLALAGCAWIGLLAWRAARP